MVSTRCAGFNLILYGTGSYGRRLEWVASQGIPAVATYRTTTVERRMGAMGAAHYTGGSRKV
jgi:hypothetical protein